MPPARAVPLARSMGRAHKVVKAWCNRQLEELDASVTEWIVLFNIADAPEPGASQAEIARFSDMGGPALVRHIDRLEADGLVTRTRDPDDRRTLRLQLTAAGRRRFEAIRDVVHRCDAQLRGVVTTREADVMQQALRKLFDFCSAELEPTTAAARSKS
jgi:MarR family transcriptional regulator for hemolysin